MNDCNLVRDHKYGKLKLQDPIDRSIYLGGQILLSAAIRTGSQHLAKKKERKDVYRSKK